MLRLKILRLMEIIMLHCNTPMKCYDSRPHTLKGRFVRIRHYKCIKCGATQRTGEEIFTTPTRYFVGIYEDAYNDIISKLKRVIKGGKL
jgi:transposase-like protein